MRIAAHKAAAGLVALVFAALAFRLFRLTGQYAVNIFFSDQWEFNDATLFQHHSLWQIFRWQHGPHRQGLGGLLAALIEPWFRWNSRTEALVAAGLMVLAGLLLLLLKYRLFGPFTWTDVALPLLVFTPAQWESLWLTMNFAHGTLPFLLILVYCLLWTWRNQRVKYALLVLLNFGILYTGFGIFIGLLTPVLLFLRTRSAGRERAYLAGCTAASLVSLGSYFISYVNQSYSGCPSLYGAPPGDYLRFVALLYSNPLALRGTGGISVLAGAFVLGLVAAVAAAAWRQLCGGFERASARPLVLAILSAYSLLFCAAASLGRTCLGLMDAHSSRYTLYLQLGMLSLYFASLAFQAPGRRALLPVMALLLFLPSLWIPPSDRDNIEGFHDLKAEWRACYLAGNSIETCQTNAGDIYRHPDLAQLRQKLDFLRSRRLNLFSDAPR